VLSRSGDLCRRSAAAKESAEVSGCWGGGRHPLAPGSVRIDVPGGTGHRHNTGEQGLALEDPSGCGEAGKGWVLGQGSPSRCLVGTTCILPWETTHVKFHLGGAERGERNPQTALRTLEGGQLWLRALIFRL